LGDKKGGERAHYRFLVAGEGDAHEGGERKRSGEKKDSIKGDGRCFQLIPARRKKAAMKRGGNWTDTTRKMGKSLRVWGRSTILLRTTASG